MEDRVRLQPINESDLALIVRGEWDPDVAGEFQWFGFKMDKVRKIERRWHDDGLIGEESSYLAVIVDHDTCVGCVDWRPIGPYGNLEMGILLFPEHRGRGIGTEAQRKLVDYLFTTTTAHRIQAGTEVDNIAEQRALEKVGFRREGVNRGVVYRAGRWRDGITYGLLRDDVGASSPNPEAPPTSRSRTEG